VVSASVVVVTGAVVVTMGVVVSTADVTKTKTSSFNILKNSLKHNAFLVACIGSAHDSGDSNSILNVYDDS